MESLRLSLMSATPTAIRQERCLWQRHQGASCKYCLDACQTGALQVVGSVISVNNDRCTGCGACLIACPVECFETSDWSERSLVSTAERVGFAAIELACKCHPTPEVGTEAAPVLKVNTCLAAISPGLWFELGRKYSVRARLECCSACLLGKTALLTRHALELAGNWLKAGGFEDHLVVQETIVEPGEALRRRVISAERPILNRRDFLFGFARSSGSVEQAFSFLPDDQAPGGDSKKLPPHLPAWLRRVAAIYSTRVSNEPVEVDQIGEEAQTGIEEASLSQPAGALWPTLRVAENCAACGACARYCPSGALSTGVRDGKYQHIFFPGACVACGLCARVCSTRALTRDYEPFTDPFQEHVMAERQVAFCRKCGSPALRTNNGFCYWCATEAPMGSLLDSARSHLLTGMNAGSITPKRLIA